MTTACTPTESMSAKVTRLSKNLICVSQIPVAGKLGVAYNKFQIHPFTYRGKLTEWWTRWYDSRDITADALENLYADTFETISAIERTVDINKVLLPNRTCMLDIENERYLMNKEWLESLVLRLDESLAGLRNLNTTYGGKETVYPVLIGQCEQQIVKARAFCARLDAAYKKLKPLHAMSNVEATSTFAPTPTESQSSITTVGTSASVEQLYEITPTAAEESNIKTRAATTATDSKKR